jgi:hypothetical protein
LTYIASGRTDEVAMKYTSFNILTPYKEKEFEGYVNLDLYIASGRTGKAGQHDIYI